MISENEGKATSHGVRRRFLHVGPILSLFCISLIFFTSIYCHLMWWPPWQSVWALMHQLVFMLIAVMVLSNFFNCLTLGPGFVPIGWSPENAEHRQYLQYCEICKSFKIPRSHHCRTCNRCVLKMDHHCPWINTCCGHMNQRSFVMFLFWAIVGSLQAGYILLWSIYHALFFAHYLLSGAEQVPLVALDVYTMLLTLVAFSAAAGVSIALSVLLFLQMRLIIRNRTCVETYIEEKAKMMYREDEFIFPYDLGWKDNLRQVFTSPGNGIHWPVIDGCDQFTLTVEQLNQKIEKRMNSELCTVKDDYNGARFTLAYGWRVFVAQPILTPDSCMPLAKGESVTVTRCEKYWAYGCKELSDGSKRRGWFPKCCVALQEFLPSAQFEQSNGVRKCKQL